MPALQTIVDTTPDDIGFKAQVVTGFRERVHQAAVEATKEVFNGEIVPAAKAGSAVATGRNRDSIVATFRDWIQFSRVSAWISTHSGYGWLIEHGTSHNRELTRKNVKARKGKVPVNDRTPPRPYIYPAMIRNLSKIPERAKAILEQLMQ